MAESSTQEVSVFQTKYNDFVDDLLGALPEYTSQINVAKALDDAARLSRFQEEVKVVNTMGPSEYNNSEYKSNPGKVLPGVEIEDNVWNQLSENTQRAIWEHVRILSICCFLEAGFNEKSRPSWMNDAMDEMKKKLESVDFQSIIGKFMNFFNAAGNSSDEKTENGLPSGMNAPPGLEGLFNNGFPKMPERFLKGHMAKLAQEIVKEITPSDLGITPEMIKECEKDPSRAFNILFSTFTSDPSIIHKTIMKIGNRLQQKVMSGAIRPQEIAREAEELMKEFWENKPFVEMMEGIKSAFGFEDMDLARKAGKEGTARMALVRDRLRKKLEKKNQANKK